MGDFYAWGVHIYVSRAAWYAAGFCTQRRLYWVVRLGRWRWERSVRMGRLHVGESMRRTR